MATLLNSLMDRIRANPVRWAVYSLLAGMLLGGTCGGWYCSRGGEDPAPVVEEKIVTQEVIQEVPVTVEVPVVQEVPVTTEVTREVPVTIEVPMVVEVPVPVTIEVPVTVEVPATVAPTPTPETATPVDGVTLTLTPASGPPGTRVQLQWSGPPPFDQGAAYFDGSYLSDYRRCGLGLCGFPHIGVITIPDDHDAAPGPYLVGVGDGQQLITAIWMMTR